jgi:hypothetical protein
LALMIPPRELNTLIEMLINKPLLTRQDLSRRYSCTLRTIDNWHSRGILPAAVYLKGSVIPLWRPGDVERHERRKQFCGGSGGCAGNRHSFRPASTITRQPRKNSR